MAKGISIGVASDTREFSSGIKSGVIKPLEGVDKALDDVAKGGTDAGAKLEHSLDGARRETSAFKKDQGDLGRAMAKAQGDGTQSLALNSSQRNKISRTAVRQAGATAKQSLASDLQSMDGTAAGALGAIGNTVGGIFASLGPLGAGIGAAVGVATGLIAGMVSKGSAQTKKFKEEVSKLGTQFIETGRDSAEAMQPTVDKLKEMATTTEEGIVTLQRLKELTEGGAISFADAATAYAGNEAELRKVIAANDDYIDKLYLLRDTEFTTANNGDVITGYDKKIEKAEQLGTYLNDTRTKIREAAKAEKLYAASGAPEMLAKADQVKTINAAYDEAAGSVEKYLNKEKKFSPKKFINDMQEREKALDEYQKTIGKVGLSPEARAFIESQGLDSAADFLKGYKKSNDKNRKELNRIWTEAGKANSGEYRESVQKGFDGKALDAPKVETPKVDVDSLLRNTQREIDRRPPLIIKTKAVDRNGKRVD